MAPERQRRAPFLEVGRWKTLPLLLGRPSCMEQGTMHVYETEIMDAPPESGKVSAEGEVVGHFAEEEEAFWQSSFFAPFDLILGRPVLGGAGWE